MTVNHVEDVRLRQLLAHPPVLGQTSLDSVADEVVAGFGAGPTATQIAVGRATAGRVALVPQQRRGDRPAIVDLADDVRVGDHDVVQELLAELPRPVEPLDPSKLNGGLVHLHDEHRQPPVLGHLPVRACQADGVGRPESPGAPHLRPVDHPLVTAAGGPRQATGQVRASRRFRQELGPVLVTAQHRRDVTLPLFLGPVVEQRGAENRQRGDVETQRHLITRRLVRESLLVRRGKTPAAVLFGERDPRVAGVEQPPLQLTGEVTLLVPFEPVALADALRQRSQVLLEPHPRPEQELFNVDHDQEASTSLRGWSRYEAIRSR